MALPIIVGLAVGILMAVWSGFRAVTGRHPSLMRNPDGSIFGGLVMVTIGVGVLWFLIAAGITWLVTLPL